jgi:hypothetical protein
MDKDPKSKNKGVSRRDFIKGIGGGALSAAVVPKLLTGGPSIRSSQRNRSR